MGAFRFLTKHHIRRGDDFRRAYRRRATASDQFLLLFGNENGLKHPRLGLSVSRKVGNAVVRNRWKRLIREAFRQTQAQLPVGIDLVVIPRPGVTPKLESLKESLTHLARRLATRLARDRR